MKPRRTTVDPEFDLTVNVPRLGELRSFIERREWPAASELLGDIGVASENDLAVAAGVVANTPGAERFLDEVVREDPGNIGARVLRAYRRIGIAWEARSGLTADHVSQAQFEEFHRHLRTAEIELIELCALAPWMALPWTLRLMTARGLSLGQSEAQRRYDRLARHHPRHFFAQEQLLQGLCPKWGGTWDAAFGFARACAATAEAGGPAHALIAIAHLERWLELPKAEGDAYFADAATRAEVTTAAERSVFHPAFSADFLRIELHSLFAVTQSVAGAHNEARRHFEALGATASAGWFGYLGDPADAFRRQLAAATAKGRA